MKIEKAELDTRTVLGLREVVPMTELTAFFARAFAAAAEELAKQGNHPAGPPVAIYYGQPTDTVTVTAGFPAIRPAAPAAPANPANPANRAAPANPAAPADSSDATPGLVVAELRGGPAVTAIHIGAYDQLSASYGKIAAWMMEHQLKPTNEMWEEYLVGPDSVADPALWQTRIVFPVA